jgi:transposase
VSWNGLAAPVRTPQLILLRRVVQAAAAGKRQTLITTAIAREMAAFLWAIGQEVQPFST